jgi:hypothetical protein
MLWRSALVLWHDKSLDRQPVPIPAMLPNELFETALGLTKPWFVQGIKFDQQQRCLIIGVDFVAGSRFAYAGADGRHPVHDTQIKRYRHLNFFQFECILEVRVPRVQLSDGRVYWSSRTLPESFPALRCCSRRWC